MSDEWLNNLAVGNAVFIQGRHGVPAMACVHKRTATQIVVKDGELTDGSPRLRRFRAMDGRETGPGDRWCGRAILRQDSQELRENLAVAKLTNKARRLMESVAIPSDRAGLESLIAAVTPFAGCAK
jgi:hypothetical protein